MAGSNYQQITSLATYITSPGHPESPQKAKNHPHHLFGEILASSKFQGTVTDSKRWPEVSFQMNEKMICFSKAKSSAEGVRIQPVDINDFRGLTRILDRLKALYHTFTLPKEKTKVLPSASKARTCWKTWSIWISN